MNRCSRIFPVLVLGAVTCVAGPTTASTDDGFALTATAKDFSTYFPGELGNGYLTMPTGLRGTESNLAYLVAFMDYGKDDIARPAAIPGWSGIDYSTGASDLGQDWLNRMPVDADLFRDYRQMLDMHAATLTTRYRYFDHGKATAIRVITFISAASPHLAVSRFSMTPAFDGVVDLSFPLTLWAPYQPRLPLATLSGSELPNALKAHNLTLQPKPPATPDRAAVWYHGDTHVLADDGDARNLTLRLDGQANNGLHMGEAVAVALPNDLHPVNVKLHKGIYQLSLDLHVRVEKGHTYAFTKYVTISREGWGGDGKADLALAERARKEGFDTALAAQRAAWDELWQSDIRIDGDPRAQQAVHADLYYLLSNVAPDTSWGVGACGITTGYVGHVFWDSDTWLFPALLLLHPDRAKSIVMFRDRTLSAARRNALALGYLGAKYPWEADPQNGTEQVLHAAWRLGRNEIHVSADVAIAQWQYWLATHDIGWLREDGWPVIRDVAEFWASRATYDPATGRYHIAHVNSVEEHYTDVTDDTFTDASAAKVLRAATAAAAVVGAKPDPRWAAIAAALDIPFSTTQDRHLDFGPGVPHDVGGSDLALLAFPSLDLAMGPQVRRNDYRFAAKPMDRPGRSYTTMGLAPFAIAAAALGDTAEAARWLRRDAAADMLKPPFDVRTETVDNNTGYFLTGSGGFLQALIYGLTGLRIERDGLVAAYPPVLPLDWKSMTLKHVSFRGRYYDFTLDRDAAGKVRLQRKPL
jgi:trehalose/maltose hydrolase-like predicted phosphorylase